MYWIYFFFFFFQAEDGIRDLTVTGVQTCALPISATASLSSCPISAGNSSEPSALMWTARNQRASALANARARERSDRKPPVPVSAARGRRSFSTTPPNAAGPFVPEDLFPRAS